MNLLGFLIPLTAQTTTQSEYPNVGFRWAYSETELPVYGFIYDYGRDNLLQGGPQFGAIEGDRSVHAAQSLVNEKLTFCMHFPIPD